MEQVLEHFYKVVISEDGTKSWYLDGKLHRENGPAVEYANGGKIWYLNGQRHREDGPAVEYANGKKSWYLNGKHYLKMGFNQIMAKKNRLSARPCVGKTVTVDGIDYKLA